MENQDERLLRSVEPEDLRFYCENCQEFQPALMEEFKPALPNDTPNAGYVLADICCSVCAWIIGTMRRPAPS